MPARQAGQLYAVEPRVKALPGDSDVAQHLPVGAAVLPETIPVRDAHRFDTARLASLLAQRLGAHLDEVRQMRGGQIYDPKFGSRMKGEGIFADQIRATFQTFRRRYGLDRPRPELSTAAFRRPGEQLSLFGSHP